MISIVTCSPATPEGDQKFQQVQGLYQNALLGELFEIVRISDATSLAEGYIRGIGQARGEIIVFSHNDAGPLRVGFGTRLRSHLQKYDVVGGAGTDRLVGPMWFSAGPPHVFGQVMNVMPPQPNFGVAFQIAGQNIAHVSQITPGSPPAEHLHVGDLVTGINGEPVSNNPQEFLQSFARSVIETRKVVFDLKRKMGDQMVAKTITIEYPKELPMTPLFNLSVFGTPGPAIGGIQAIDGFFMAARREVLHENGAWFDPKLCDGFHMYDLDFSFRAYRNGLKVAVANDLFLGHASAGGYSDPKWRGAADKWMEVYGSMLHPHRQFSYNLTSMFFTSVPECTHMMDELVEQTLRSVA